jgi:hypothetical protein
VRLVVNIQPGAGAWDLAEDVVTMIEGLAFQSETMTVEVDRNRAEAEDDREIVVDVKDDGDG